MAKKTFTTEQIISKLREAEVLLSQGQTVPTMCKASGVMDQTYYRWRKAYTGLRNVSEKGWWNAWLMFRLNGVSVQALDAVERINKMNDLRETYRRRFQGGRSAARLLQVIDLLFARPLISVHTVETKLGLPYPTAERYIDELVKQKILVGTGKARNRLFRAEEIIQVIENK